MLEKMIKKKRDGIESSEPKSRKTIEEISENKAILLK